VDWVRFPVRSYTTRETLIFVFATWYIFIFEIESGRDLIGYASMAAQREVRRVMIIAIEDVHLAMKIMPWP